MKTWPTENTKNSLDEMNTHISKFVLLTNGQKLYCDWHLDGGGTDYRNYFLKAIADFGKSHYNFAYEWCCGHSILGFEALTNGICDTLAISDCHDLAVNTSLDNAKRLGYEDKVIGYITPKISNIPNTEKWDLVIGNPPNSMNGDNFIRHGEENGYTEEHILHELRIAVDDNFETHKEFFGNIKNYLNEDADIFITLHATMIHYTVEQITEPNGFVIKNVIDMMPRDPSLKIVHFKSV
jgi:methylase of polypeptide subunit release factors